jgi:hypothetical protein
MPRAQTQPGRLPRTNNWLAVAVSIVASVLVGGIALIIGMFLQVDNNLTHGGTLGGLGAGAKSAPGRSQDSTLLFIVVAVAMMTSGVFTYFLTIRLRSGRSRRARRDLAEG